MKKVTIGVIGAGRIGRLHAENLKTFHNVVVKSISDIFVTKAWNWARDIGIEMITDDYQQILDDPEIDAVLICSPTDTHPQILIEAAEAGKHIFCEKPVSFSLTESQQAVRKAVELGRKLQVGFNRRFDHNFQRVRSMVETNEIGVPHLLKITSRDPEPPSDEYIAHSGGIFIDMSIHDFDMARFLIGSEVVEVYVQGAALIDPVFSKYDDVDTAIISLKFASGALGVIDNSRKAIYGYDQRVEILGSKGSVRIDNDYPNTAQLLTSTGVYQDKPKFFFLERYREAYREELRQFISAILDKQAVPVDGFDALQAEVIAHAAKQSLQEGKPISIPAPK
ncbi:inositol 2-dehydrogenase [Shimazuella alba]|uniref:Inositol 2-dehydrogenase n=1 Tax=Shimazuella alba TaxID=2690964 RepID=A0A6I4VZR3_9BACL|nr:inositol 2-dehydrogenase [Shimazuella alba]MXQ55226.1 inositol 2-dehydrogenase [Shimazuella alba]